MPINAPTYSDFVIIIVWYCVLFIIVVYLSIGNNNSALEYAIDFSRFTDNFKHSENCRHTKQGAHFVTDDQGFLCRKGDELQQEGCCPHDNLLLQNTCMTCVYCL